MTLHLWFKVVATVVALPLILMAIIAGLDNGWSERTQGLTSGAINAFLAAMLLGIIWWLL